jgi:trehalose-phosphatase
VTLWVFDFDGTLSPLVPERTAAALDPACRRMLEELVAVRLFRCAILSNRALGDLAPRIDVPGVFLGGGSGLEWRLPDGGLRSPGAEEEQRTRLTRESVMPAILAWGRLPGVDIEDKRWSVAVHVRHADAATQRQVGARVEECARRHALRVFRGPEVFEIQLVPGVDKAFGVRALCELTGFRPRTDRLVYAGDDENDAQAMRLAMSWGGAAVTVGERVRLAGTERVPEPAGLAQTIRRLAGLPG